MNPSDGAKASMVAQLLKEMTRGLILKLSHKCGSVQGAARLRAQQGFVRFHLQHQFAVSVLTLLFSVGCMLLPSPYSTSLSGNLLFR